MLADDYSLTYRSAFVPTDSGGLATNKDDKSTTLPSHPRMLSGSLAIDMIRVGMLIGLSQLFATIVSAEVMLWQNVGHYSRRRNLMYFFIL